MRIIYFVFKNPHKTHTQKETKKERNHTGSQPKPTRAKRELSSMVCPGQHCHSTTPPSVKPNETPRWADATLHSGSDDLYPTPAYAYCIYLEYCSAMGLFQIKGGSTPLFVFYFPVSNVVELYIYVHILYVYSKTFLTNDLSRSTTPLYLGPKLL